MTVGGPETVETGALDTVSPSFCRSHFALAERVLGIDTNDPHVAHLLEAAYSPAVRAGMPSAHHAAIRRLADGRLNVRFDRRALPASSHAAPMLSAHYAVKEVFARFAAAHPAGIALYGSLVAIDRQAVLILGPTAIGKTLLALHLAWQGGRFLGDETAVLDFRSSTIYALARKPALRESALPMLPAGSIAERMNASECVMQTERGRLWYALDAAELQGIHPSPAGYPLRAVCILRDRDGDFRMSRVPADRALPALVQRAYQRPAELTVMSALRRSLRNTAFFEVSLGLPDESAASLMAQVRACV